MQALIQQTNIKHHLEPPETCIKAWHLTAKDRGEPMMIEGISSRTIWSLGLLREPFSPRLAKLLHPNIESLIEREVLEYCGGSTKLRFRFVPFRWMVQQSLMVKDKYKKLTPILSKRGDLRVFQRTLIKCYITSLSLNNWHQHMSAGL